MILSKQAQKFIKKASIFTALVVFKYGVSEAIKYGITKAREIYYPKTQQEQPKKLEAPLPRCQNNSPANKPSL